MPYFMILDGHSSHLKQRRRISDAKWRAHVSDCYKTLKTLVPLVMDSPSGRQVSKVNTCVMIFSINLIPIFSFFYIILGSSDQRGALSRRLPGRNTQGIACEERCVVSTYESSMSHTCSDSLLIDS